MIEIHVYGDLRRYAPDSRAASDSVIVAATTGSETINDLLHRAGIPRQEIAQVFLNGQLLTTSCSMAPYLGYITARDCAPEGKSPWETEVRDGDRLGLFPPRMSMLVV